MARRLVPRQNTDSASRGAVAQSARSPQLRPMLRHHSAMKEAAGMNAGVDGPELAWDYEASHLVLVAAIGPRPIT